VTYLLDTNVVSEVRKRRPDPRVLEWFDRTSGTELFLSVLVLGEIRQGVERRRRTDPRVAISLDEWLSELHRTFADRVLPITAEIADQWGELNVPDPVPTVDGLLAATALVHGLILVTRNTADVARTGVVTLDPFTA
jgi:predicted nucleic acid-binding protein